MPGEIPGGTSLAPFPDWPVLIRVGDRGIIENDPYHQTGTICLNVATQLFKPRPTPGNLPERHNPEYTAGRED